MAARKTAKPEKRYVVICMHDGGLRQVYTQKSYDYAIAIAGLYWMSRDLMFDPNSKEVFLVDPKYFDPDDLVLTRKRGKIAYVSYSDTQIWIVQEGNHCL